MKEAYQVQYALVALQYSIKKERLIMTVPHPYEDLDQEKEEIYPQVKTSEEEKQKFQKESKKNYAYAYSILILALLFLIGAGAYKLYQTNDWSDEEASFNFAGKGTETFGESAKDISETEALQVLDQAFLTLKANYYEEKTNREILDLFLSQSASHIGNRFTRYMNAEETADFLEDIQGIYAGIGTSVKLDVESLEGETLAESYEIAFTNIEYAIQEARQEISLLKRYQDKDDLRTRLEAYTQKLLDKLKAVLANEKEKMEQRRYGLQETLASPQELAKNRTEKLELHYKISEVFPGSPAEEAGLQPEDEIIAINGQDMSEFPTMSSFIQAVKGPENSQIQITFYRPSTNETKEISVTRRLVTKQVVEYRLISASEYNTPADVGYIRMREFTKTLPEQFAAALKKVKEQGLKHLILDLRFNPGGDAEALQACLNMLLHQGEIATIRGRYEGEVLEETWYSEDGTLLDDDVKVIALVNRNSASASEFFVGALKDRRENFILMGETTFGKGVATSTFSLKDHSALQVTIFEYILPSGYHVEGLGIPPSEGAEIETTEEEAFVNPANFRPGEDPYISRAMKTFFGS